MIHTFNGITPRVDDSAYIQQSAQIIGDVHIGEHSSVWFNTVLRGDVFHIRIGARTNIQDNSTVHVTTGRDATIVGDGVTIGHNVVLHGCEIGSGSLIGIGAIVMDGCKIGECSLIGAGALVTPGTVIAPQSLVLGSPAKVIRRLRAKELNNLEASAQRYVDNAQRYLDSGIQ